MPRARGCVVSVSLGIVSALPLFDALGQQPPPRQPGDYLVEVTEGMGRADPRLGDLRSKGMFPTDIELRFWSGYGFTGTRAIIINRTSGHWMARRVNVRECRLYLPSALGDTLSDASRIRYEADARRRCDRNPPPLKGGGRVIATDTLDVVEVRSGVNLADVWQQLTAAGVESLPPRLPRRLSIDGYGYVVQLRVGRTYRVSMIEHVEPPRFPADTVVQRVYDILSREIGWRE